MSDLADLYQEVIIDHSRKPRNFCACDNPTHQAEGYNPLCGDQLELFLTIQPDNTIAKASFVGEGCAISTASASLLTEAVKGKTVDEAHALFQDFHEMIIEEKPSTPKLGKLAILEGVRKFPMRVKCATLAWHTLEAALNNQHQVTTE